MKILSSRGRANKARQDHQRHLEEKFQLSHHPLSKEERDHIEKVFDSIRKQLDEIGLKCGWIF